MQALQNWLTELEKTRPMTKREKLELDLNEAVKREDYEAAARVRDALKNLESSE
jgi:protein-arginine kinase activator protein McsA